MNYLSTKFSWTNVKDKKLWIIVIACFVVDQLSKYLIIWQVPLFSRIEVLPFFNIVHSKNKGAAFGMFNDASPVFRFFFFSAVTIGCLWLLIYWIGTTPRREKFVRICFGLLLGGALGNVKDRVIFHEVTDFIQVHYDNRWYFPAFNVADSCITVGVTCLLIHGIYGWAHEKKSKR